MALDFLQTFQQLKYLENHKIIIYYRSLIQVIKFRLQIVLFLSSAVSVSLHLFINLCTDFDFKVL